MHKRLLQLVALLMAAMMLLAACGGGDDENGGTDAGGGDNAAEDSPEDDAAAGDTATFTAVDFGFQGPETLPAGEVSLELENEGKEPHMMAFIELLQGKTIEDVNAFIEKNGLQGPPPPWAREVKGGVGVAKPGESKTGKAELKPGSYIAMCFVTSKKNDNQPHAALGMIYPITVEA
jgi:hypothetical protein